MTLQYKVTGNDCDNRWISNIISYFMVMIVIDGFQLL